MFPFFLFSNICFFFSLCFPLHVCTLRVSFFYLFHPYLLFFCLSRHVLPKEATLSLVSFIGYYFTTFSQPTNKHLLALRKLCKIKMLSLFYAICVEQDFRQYDSFRKQNTGCQTTMQKTRCTKAAVARTTSGYRPC